MASMHISLSDIMKNWVEGQIASGQYHNASEYVRDLIRRDQDGKQRLNALQSHLAQGEADIAAGDYTPLHTANDVKAHFKTIKRSEG